MIIVTGAAGFIGSVLVGALNEEGRSDLILVDEFIREDKLKNLEDKSYEKKIDRADFINWFEANAEMVSFIFHIGARTDTTEFDVDIFNRLNLNYTKDIWKICSEYEIQWFTLHQRQLMATEVWDTTTITISWKN